MPLPRDDSIQFVYGKIDLSPGIDYLKLANNTYETFFKAIRLIRAITLLPEKKCNFPSIFQHTFQINVTSTGMYMVCNQNSLKSFI